jgi:hypothetical protein
VGSVFGEVWSELAKGFSIYSTTYEKSPTIWWIKSHNSGMKNWNFTIKYTDCKTINSNNCCEIWSVRPSVRRDVLWYSNVRLCVRPFHMSPSNLRTPWPIHFKFHRVIGIDGLEWKIEISPWSIQTVRPSIPITVVKFEVNWPRVSQFTARHTKNCLQFDE